MKTIRIFVFILVIFAFIGVLFGSSAPVVQAFGTHTTVYLTARVQNKWWYAGNLSCKSATLETMGQTYEGVIAQGNWWGLAGNESCFITFEKVLYPLSLTPGTVTVSYYTLVGDELLDMVTADRLQVQQKDYFLDLAWYDDYVIFDDMILEDTSALPIINFDPTALP